MIRVGTSGWSYPEWMSSFYEDIPQRRWLEHYASVFRTVEAHMTARRSLTKSVADKWIASVPEGFRFATKAPPWAAARQADLGDRTARFASALETLGEHTGPVLVAPPFARDESALEALLTAWPKSLQLAIELRHESWNGSKAGETAARHGAALVTVDRDQRSDPIQVTADHAYLRLRRDSYTRSDLERWAKTIDSIEARDTWVFVRHGEDAPVIAAQLQELLA